MPAMSDWLSYRLCLQGRDPFSTQVSHSGRPLITTAVMEGMRWNLGALALGQVLAWACSGLGWAVRTASREHPPVRRPWPSGT
jgi:hypothetical protein